MAVLPAGVHDGLAVDGQAEIPQGHDRQVRAGQCGRPCRDGAGQQRRLLDLAGEMAGRCRRVLGGQQQGAAGRQGDAGCVGRGNLAGAAGGVGLAEHDLAAGGVDGQPQPVPAPWPQRRVGLQGQGAAGPFQCRLHTDRTGANGNRGAIAGFGQHGADLPGQAALDHRCPGAGALRIALRRRLDAAVGAEGDRLLQRIESACEHSRMVLECQPRAGRVRVAAQHLHQPCLERPAAGHAHEGGEFLAWPVRETV